MEYTRETYQELLEEDPELYGEESEIIKKMLGESDLTKITLTTSEDVISNKRYVRFKKLVSDNYKEETVIFTSYGDGYSLSEIGGIKVVLCFTPFEIIFLKIEDKEEFEKIFENV